MQQDLIYRMRQRIKPLWTKISIPILVFLVTTVGVFPLDVYLPSMPKMAVVFDVSIAQIASTISYFMFSFSVMQLLNGPLSDAFGRKVVLMTGLFIGGVATLGFLWVESFYGVILLRILQAIGLSSFVVTQAIIRDVYSGITAVKMQVFVAVLLGVLIAVSPLVGSFLQHYWGWQGSFVLCGTIIFITFFYVLFCYTETNHFIDVKIACQQRFFMIIGGYLTTVILIVMRALQRSLSLRICVS